MRAKIIKDKIQGLDAEKIRENIPEALAIVKNEITGEVEIYFDEDVITEDQVKQMLEQFKKKIETNSEVKEVTTE